MSAVLCARYTWTYSVNTIPIAPGQLKALAPQATFIPKVVLSAEMTNFTHICIGSSQIQCNQTTGITNGALIQVTAGSMGVIEVDDPMSESFDLGQYYATHGDPTHTVLLFVSIYQVKREVSQQ